MAFRINSSNDYYYYYYYQAPVQPEIYQVISSISFEDLVPSSQPELSQT